MSVEFHKGNGAIVFSQTGNNKSLTRARQAVKKSKRARKEAEHRAVAAAVIGFEPARARHRLRQAEFAVKQMLAQLVASRAGRIDFAMVRKIGAAETRVAEAREALRKIDPTSAARPGWSRLSKGRTT